MSVNYYDKQNSRIVGIAGGNRLWIGSKAAHDAEVVADKMSYNVLVAILETGLYYRNASGVESPIISGSGDIQTVVLPTASSGNLGKILQYIGTTDVNYTHGHFYECIEDGVGGYEWNEIDVQDGGGTDIQVTSLPTAGAASLGKVLQYLGEDTSELTHGFFYECIYDAPDYKWQQLNTQEVDEGLTTEQMNSLLALLD